MSRIERPVWARLVREGKGLVEFRVKGKDKVQYRPIACDDSDMKDGHQNSDRIFLLGGAIEKDRKFHPTGILQTNQRRKMDLIASNRYKAYKP